MRRVLLLLLFLAGCVTNPYSGRSQFLVMGRGTENQLGRQAYQQALGKVRISANPSEVEPCVRVAERIQIQANKWMKEKEPDIKFAWEINVIQDPETANAFVLPGGKMAVYTGIFPAAHNEAGLAVILGHEVAHAMLRHGGERMSENLGIQIGAVVLGVSLHKKSKKTLALAMAAYGVGSQLAVALPHSRSHETEADRIGLILAARAGYDPMEGIRVWQRMDTLYGSGTLEFLSTHPAHQTRIDNMKEWMPEMIPLYEEAARAPMTILPKPGQGPIAGETQIQIQSYQAVKNNEEGTLYPFKTDKDIYLEEILVHEPSGTLRKIEVGLPIEGKQKTEVLLGALSSGKHYLTFQGSRSGRPFKSSVSIDAP